MSKITQNYIEARRDGIKWLNSQKRDYSTGVNILTRSGYKGFVAARLARQGEKPHTREKLEYVNPEKPDVPLNKNDAFQKVQKRRVQEKR